MRMEIEKTPGSVKATRCFLNPVVMCSAYVATLRPKATRK